MKIFADVKNLSAPLRWRWTIFLSALSMAGAGWIIGELIGTPLLAPYVALLLFALMMYLLAERYAQRRGVEIERALLQDIHGASAEAQAFVSGLQQLLAQQIHCVDDETGRLQTIIEDAMSKLVSNFTAVSELLREQQNITSVLSERAGATTDCVAQPKVAALHQQGFDDVARIVEEINAQVNSAITALQFHDMSSQLLDHIRKRLLGWSSLTQSTENGVTIMSREGWTVLLEALRKYNEQLEELNHVPVSQSDVDSGDIEFF